MSDTTIRLDQADEDVLFDLVSDDAMERAGLGMDRAALTIAQCSGLNSCPSAPA
jgi:hypothetical protein